MNETVREVLRTYQTRKTRRQKDAFFAFLQSKYPSLRAEEGGLIRSRNLVLGDVSRARVVFAAHYDTCARLPFPNLIFPENLALSFLYSLLICIPFLLLGGVAGAAGIWLFHNPAGVFLGQAAAIFAMLYVFFLGVPNRNTANDNTSGVAVLLSLIDRIGVPDGAAFVFFDNEENGLLGSALFRRMHRAELSRFALVNFDCVSDGDEALFVLSPAMEKRWGDTLREALAGAPAGKSVRTASSRRVFYPSDQAGFPVSCAAAAMKRCRLGLYLDRIHTARDVAFDQVNIEYFTAAAARFAGAVCGEIQEISHEDHR